MDSTATREDKLSFRARFSRPAIWLLAALVLMAVIAWIVHVSRQAQDSAQRGGMGGATAVAVATAVTGDIEVKLPALGTVTPISTVTVRA